MLQLNFPLLELWLLLVYHLVACSVGVEHFHRFLNKAVAIAANHRGTNPVFVVASHTDAYAWNTGLTLQNPAHTLTHKRHSDGYVDDTTEYTTEKCKNESKRHHRLEQFSTDSTPMHKSGSDSCGLQGASLLWTNASSILFIGSLQQTDEDHS